MIASSTVTVPSSISTMFVITQDAELASDVTCTAVGEPCIKFGAAGLTLKLNGFEMTGLANPTVGCGGGGPVPNEDGIGHRRVQEAEAGEHLRSLPDRSLDGAFARHVAEHIEPGALIEILRQLRRVLEPGAPVVFITPNVATLQVGAHTFWRDPSHRRPIPPELFEFYLRVEGFVDVSVRTYEPSEERLSEDVPEGAERENARLLNRVLFGDRDCAVIGYQPR